ncbi:hypothetical protein [Rhodopirellula sp. SWK7]|uniref:hypothetical protein n=1 Tax=Rhodopirellula sp. SWK7 TaxID=595460 RepID=UPI0002C008D4|nr:hypothetical protein [Rhodopirellula sp. SWK7]EMI45883.1 hypothetical protein RRSWK_01621 [Rhodopirellula sp. SWK7]
MIPAVLSALFVLYLYRLLNSPSDESGINPSAVGGVDGLIDRIEAMQRQVDEMTAETKETSGT